MAIHALLCAAPMQGEPVARWKSPAAAFTNCGFDVMLLVPPGSGATQVYDTVPAVYRLLDDDDVLK